MSNKVISPMNQEDLKFPESILRLWWTSQERWIVFGIIHRWIVHYTIYQ